MNKGVRENLGVATITLLKCSENQSSDVNFTQSSAALGIITKTVSVV